MTERQRARLWKSGHHAAQVSRAVVRSMYEAAGTSALYVDCPIERAHRDVHAVMQHVVFAPLWLEAAGQVEARPHTAKSNLLKYKEPTRQTWITTNSASDPLKNITINALTWFVDIGVLWDSVYVNAARFCIWTIRQPNERHSRDPAHRGPTLRRAQRNVMLPARRIERRRLSVS